MTFHREGTATLLVVLIFDTALVWASHTYLPNWLAWVLTMGAAVLLGLILNFFRMPAREIGQWSDRQVICPSDGKVVVIEEVEETEWFHDKRIQISIFMSPLNVHAQWAPIAGQVLAARHHPGKFLVAWHPKSSTENERTTHVIEGSAGTVLFRQVAGAVARRICWYMKEGDVVESGKEIGFIKFGSRVDVFLPMGSEIQVEIGQMVVGRNSLLALLPRN
jgi:phosphatidylserine decarboxylase